ncbi:unnamed protein product [Prorocentrum cordatum]|uniref:B-related factor 1 n=1 Tax=Prorocentrum cordatum TaxID=2364126 RepID=A0ABN9T6I4_9DINO|nr:unnamed protein product [Polarella glacialis]
MMSCSACGSTDLVLNPSRGDTVCGTCGEVLEERNMVVDVSFGEGEGGAKYLQGRTFQITTSQERVTSKGIAEICKIASSLDLDATIQEPGRRILTLAVQKGFNQGRSTKLIASACLYLACRRSRSHHLLIDFSDHLRRPVREIGGTYVKLMQRLLGNHARFPLDAGAPLMEIPVVDPSVFIERFARKLWKAMCLKGHPMKHLMTVEDCACNACGLQIAGSSWIFSCSSCKTFVCEQCQREASADMMVSQETARTRKQVQNTAMRLIQFMHRDWTPRATNISIPMRSRSGHRGTIFWTRDSVDTFRAGHPRKAALLLGIAAWGSRPRGRGYGSQPARICVGRRPNGLVGAALLIAAFYHKIGFSAGDISEVVRIGEGTLRLRLKEVMSTAVSSMSREEFERQGDALVADPGARQGDGSEQPPCLKRRMLNERQRQMLRRALPDAGPQATPPALLDGAAAPASAAPLLGGAASARGPAAESAPALSQVEKFTAREPSAELIEDIARDVARHHRVEGLLGGEAGSAASEGAASRIEGLLAGRQFEAEAAQGQPSAPGTPKSAAAAGAHEESLSDMDDEELDSYLLLDPEEQQHKAEIWHEVNKDYLEEWHLRSREARRKREQQEQRSQKAASDAGAASDAASEAGSARTGTSGASGKRRFPAASSCTQSAVLALTKKGKVNKNRINIENLEKLFNFE